MHLKRTMICIIQNSVLGVQNYDTFIMLRKKKSIVTGRYESNSNKEKHIIDMFSETKKI